MFHTIFHWHSFVEIQSDDGSILIDPFITWNDLCDIDLVDIRNKNIIAIIVTHWHQDHIWDSVKIAENKDCLVISTLEIVKYLVLEKGLNNTHWMNIGWEFDFGKFSVKFINALHSGSIEEVWNWYYSNPAGVIVRINWKSI